MFATIRNGTLGAIGALALASSSASAAPIAWSTPSGTTGNIAYSNGQSDNGLFGDPVLSGDNFLFFPNNFKAQASNGSAQTTSDRLSFKVSTLHGEDIQKITIKEVGDWSILGGGSVKAFGTLYVTKLNTPGFGSVYSDTLDTTYNYSSAPIVLQSPAKPVGESDGQWDGTFEITLPAGVTSAQIVLNNILQATSTTGGTSIIQKKELGSPGEGSPQFLISASVPEPTSMSILALGGLALLRRHRKPSEN
jgi:hypothetical protein